MSISTEYYSGSHRIVRTKLIGGEEFIRVCDLQRVLAEDVHKLSANGDLEAALYAQCLFQSLGRMTDV